MRKLMLIRLAFLMPILLAVFVLHVGGTALVVIHMVRLVLVVLAVSVAGWIRTHRRHQG